MSESFDQLKNQLLELQNSNDDLSKKMKSLMKDFDEHQHTGTDNSRPITDEALNAGNVSLGAGGGFATGTLKTTNATPATADMTIVAGSKPAVIFAYVIAANSADQTFGAFVRNVIYKKTPSSTYYFDQIQDLYTMREDDYKVDFVAAGDKVQIRFWGIAGKTVVWTYFYKVFISQ